MVALAVVVAAAGAGCSGSDEAKAPKGLPSARAVVDAHIDAGRRYDLAADCNLRHPDDVARMATMDNAEAEGYCTRATAEVIANATPEARAATEAIYTNPKVAAETRPGPGRWFSLDAADGSYHEDIHVAEKDGSWWLVAAEGSGADEHDHEH